MNKNENNYLQQNLVYSISLKLHLAYFNYWKSLKKYPPVFMLLHFYIMEISKGHPNESEWRLFIQSLQ